MPKQLVVYIGYSYYTGTEEDIIRMLAVAGRLTAVQRANYSGPYTPALDQSPFVQSASLEDVELDAPQPLAAEPIAPAPAVADEGPF